MTVPADGVDRLIYFVENRIAQLGLSKDEVARRGGPVRDTLTKIRGLEGQRRPTVDVLMRLDATMGWHAGSSAVILLGGQPLSLTITAGAHQGDTASVSAPVRRGRRRRTVQPVTVEEIIDRLVQQVDDQIREVENVLAGLRGVRQALSDELIADEDLRAAYSAGSLGAQRTG